MRVFLVFCLFTSLAYARNTVTSTIVDLEKSSSTQDKILIYLASGEVLHANNFHGFKNQLYQFKFDSDHKLLSATPVSAKEKAHEEENENHMEEYTPTYLSKEQIDKNFHSYRKGARRFSQCFNRAHVWAYESKKTYGINSMKVFLFFTKKFIRENKFKWWFHVAPSNYLKSSNQNELKVLDPFFNSKPLSLDEWTKHFVSKNVNCLEARLFSEYEANQEKELCLTIKSSMYFLQPKDLKTFEERGIYKKDWVGAELKRAYRNGFGK